MVRWWLRAFRAAAVVNGLITLYGVVNVVIGTLPPTDFAFALLATSAVVISLVLATRLARHGVSDYWFVKGTTTLRIVGFGWVLIGVAFVLSTIAVIFGVDLNLTSSESGIFGAIGGVALLAVVGPGYSEYREALTSLDQPTE